jgi:hypothetical protein
VSAGIDAVGAMRSHGALADPDLAVITAVEPEHLAGLVDAATVAREEAALLSAASRDVRRRAATTRSPEICRAACRTRGLSYALGQLIAIDSDWRPHLTPIVGELSLRLGLDEASPACVAVLTVERSQRSGARCVRRRSGIGEPMALTDRSHARAVHPAGSRRDDRAEFCVHS